MYVLKIVVDVDGEAEARNLLTVAVDAVRRGGELEPYRAWSERTSGGAYWCAYGHGYHVGPVCDTCGRETDLT